ncbi:hypothetical protein VPH35_103741 [Triticum aestivum]|uniref:uncharacterized protein n=1 Tax=Triticum aestivum TaxID=4565 RepID=UPI001D031CCE|nr:uncharacterized protein LOC123132283 [Triticum aestivum]XP_044408005.1 uncharacterized protein LOC123132283 [Triticum aestivum]XP_044408006.1 uncharacterized protein LOC123132283 [Triticum aestivum]XP_044408007.1 uncharacterized protein LOC123132283 [Triticum aestivum]XP_044408008.1 uncharacterized protein LOC123132283 [Triticum aestivum]XP_044408010.1 uncharacterized protein LOC123132283 [Triticum aestivum]XP_044408011.1 uncharacterized protein LOC123132283 [Triticum aestivum]XP_04440801
MWRLRSTTPSLLAGARVRASMHDASSSWLDHGNLQSRSRRRRRDATAAAASSEAAAAPRRPHQPPASAMSSAQDPFYIVQEEIQGWIGKLQTTFHRWEQVSSNNGEYVHRTISSLAASFFKPDYFVIRQADCIQLKEFHISNLRVPLAHDGPTTPYGKKLPAADNKMLAFILQ